MGFNMDIYYSHSHLFCFWRKNLIHVEVKLLAKKLLWLFVIVNSILVFIEVINGEDRSLSEFIAIWVAISIIAVCESIEKSKTA